MTKEQLRAESLAYKLTAKAVRSGDRMTDEQKQRNLAWAEALESGEYAQGRGCLYNESRDQYCCLGVACLVAGVDVSGLDVLLPPKAIATYYGWEGADPVLDGIDGEPIKATLLNDVEHLSFPQIAKLIRRQAL